MDGLFHRETKIRDEDLEKKGKTILVQRIEGVKGVRLVFLPGNSVCPADEPRGNTKFDMQLQLAIPSFHSQRDDIFYAY